MAFRVWRWLTFLVVLCGVSTTLNAAAPLTIEIEVPRLGPAVERVVRDFRTSVSSHFDFVVWEGVAIFAVKDAAGLESRRVQLGLSRPPDWAFGVCWPARRVIIIRLDGSLSTIKETLVHELVHLIFGSGFERSKVPVWFSEGIAQMLERGFEAVRGAPDIERQRRGQPLSLTDLTARFPNHGARAQRAYAQAEAMTWFIRDELGADKFDGFIKTLNVDGRPFSEVFKQTLGYDLRVFETKFIKTMQVERWWHELFRETTLFTIMGGLLVVGGVRRRRQMFAQLKKLRRQEDLNPD
jgi:hypothetical protein